MFESELLPIIAVFFIGVAVGILATLLFNKLRTGSVSAGSIKKEKEAYQTEVEAHFEETSKKFKAMAGQYQDLYQHLSVGATTLCRPENIAQGLTDQRNPLEPSATVETKSGRTSGVAAHKQNKDKAKASTQAAKPALKGGKRGKHPADAAKSTQRGIKAEKKSPLSKPAAEKATASKSGASRK